MRLYMPVLCRSLYMYVISDIITLFWQYDKQTNHFIISITYVSRICFIHVQCKLQFPAFNEKMRSTNSFHDWNFRYAYLQNGSYL